MTRATGLFTRRLWLWPLIAALVLGVVGWWAHRQVNNATQNELGSRLRTVLMADVAALRLWFAEQQADARAFAVDSRVRQAVTELVAMAAATNASRELLSTSTSAKVLEDSILPSLLAQQYLDYVIIAPDRRILASPNRQSVYRRAPPSYDLFLNKALQG